MLSESRGGWQTLADGRLIAPFYRGAYLHCIGALVWIPDLQKFSMHCFAKEKYFWHISC